MTTEPTAADVFAALAELALRYPHWRAGQVVANAAGWADSDVYGVEDGVLLATARQHLAARPPADATTARRLAPPPELSAAS